MNIFIAKLDYGIQEDYIREVFGSYGDIDSVKIIIDKTTGKSKGYGFIEMPNDDEAREAINELNDSVHYGRPIVVKEAKPRENKERRGGGGFNRGGYDRRSRY